MHHFVENIRKTGFPFEHHISTRFRARGWTVHHGRYYVDDINQDVREIDLVVDRSDDVDGVEIHTVCVVSCKKNESNAWVMLARSADPEEFLDERSPRQVATNDHALKFMTDRATWEFDHDDALGEANVSSLSEPDQTIFAFQEMHKQTGAAQNDKAIFASITSLLKAQAYEMASHGDDRPVALYQYNLLSVLDTELVRLDFPEDDSDPVPLSVERQTYIARYIVNQKRISAPIRFVTRAGFEAELGELERLHTTNLRYFAALKKAFYTDALADWQKASVFEKQVIAELFRGHGIRFLGRQFATENLSLGWDSATKCALLQLREGTREDVAKLNEDSERRDALSALLRTFYRYDGASRFALKDDLSELLATVRRMGNAERSG